MAQQYQVNLQFLISLHLKNHVCVLVQKGSLHIACNLWDMLLFQLLLKSWVLKFSVVVYGHSIIHD